MQRQCIQRVSKEARKYIRYQGSSTWTESPRGVECTVTSVPEPSPRILINRDVQIRSAALGSDFCRLSSLVGDFLLRAPGEPEQQGRSDLKGSIEMLANGSDLYPVSEFALNDRNAALLHGDHAADSCVQ